MSIFNTILRMHNVFSIYSPKYSPSYIGYLIFVHFFAFVSIAMVLPAPLHVICLFCLIISFLFFLERDQEVLSLQYEKKTEWVLCCAHDRVLRMQLLGSSMMMRYFLVLHFKCENSSDKKTLVLFSDMFSDADYRDLRRCVKMGFL